MANRWGNNGKNERFYFGGAPKALQMVTAAMKLKDVCSLGKKIYDQPRQHIKKQRHDFANKVWIVKVMVFPVVMYGCELDHKESWALKNWCFWTMVLEKTLESPLDYKEIQPVLPKGNQSWIFTRRTDVEAETPILWPPDETWLIYRQGRLVCCSLWGHEKWDTTEQLYWSESFVRRMLVGQRWCTL